MEVSFFFEGWTGLQEACLVLESTGFLVVINVFLAECVSFVVTTTGHILKVTGHQFLT